MTHTEPESDDAALFDQPVPRMKPSLTAGHHNTSKAIWRLRAQRKAQARQKPGLAEWHTLPPGQRDADWAELCAWVTWLHDRYELDVEERLPRCWAEHPGLIEELRALRAWRIEIYNSAESSGQATRYWHAELRQTMAAAATFYASGCRAGHRGSTHPAHSDRDLQNRWTNADHSAGIPPALLTTTETTTPRHDSYLFLNTNTMTGHLDTNAARPLSMTVTELLYHDGSWWTEGEGGWLRITELETQRRLNKRSSDLSHADQCVERLRARETAGHKDEEGTSS